MDLNLGVPRYSNQCRIRVAQNILMPDNPDGMCGYRIDQSTPLDIPIIGEPPSERAQKLVMAMGKHVAKSHPEVWAAITAGEVTYKAFLVGMAFECQDPNAQHYVALLRSQVLSAIPRITITDSSIQSKVASMQLDQTTSQRVYDAMIGLRNVLTEQTPISPAVSTLVTA